MWCVCVALVTSVAVAMTLCTCLYVVNFAYSWGPLAWLVRDESSSRHGSMR